MNKIVTFTGLLLLPVLTYATEPASKDDPLTQNEAEAVATILANAVSVDKAPLIRDKNGCIWGVTESDEGMVLVRLRHRDKTPLCDRTPNQR